MGVDDGPQYIPQQSRQVFQEYLDAQTFNGLFQPVEGTNLTMATLSVTTVQNGKLYSVFSFAVFSFEIILTVPFLLVLEAFGFRVGKICRLLCSI